MRSLKLLYSPAALCLCAVCLCIGFSIASSDASRIYAFKQETKFGYAKASFPIHMKRMEEPLFNLLAARAKADMAEFLKSAEQDAAARPPDEDAGSWKPYTQSISYLELFRTLSLVSYLEVSTVVQGDSQPAITFRTINYDRDAKRELSLADVIESPADRSRPLEALADYVRSDIRDQTGEEGESEVLADLTKPDLGVYELFTFCPSTKMGKAAGLTIHFAPSPSGAFGGSDFHVTVPYTVFAKFLKPGMKALFSGEPRATPVSLQNIES